MITTGTEVSVISYTGTPEGSSPLSLSLNLACMLTVSFFPWYDSKCEWYGVHALTLNSNILSRVHNDKIYSIIIYS